MAVLIDGKKVSGEVRARIREEVAALKSEGIVPGLAVIIVGEDPASKVYVRNKKRARSAASTVRNTRCRRRRRRKSCSRSLRG